MSAFVSADSVKWFLMSRHGDCAEIATLRRKLPDMPEIDGPVSFSQYMAASGHIAVEQPLQSNKDDFAQIDVETLSLSLIFMKETLCKAFVSH